MGNLILADYYSRLGLSEESELFSKNVTFELEHAERVMEKHRGSPDPDATALVALGKSKNADFIVASYKLAHECTNAQRDGLESIDVTPVGRKYCDDIMLYKFKEAEWCGIYSEPLYLKICGE